LSGRSADAELLIALVEVCLSVSRIGYDVMILVLKFNVWSLAIIRYLDVTLLYTTHIFRLCTYSVLSSLIC
jgi:hypothetical protein